jgi:hypothetical protein
MFAEYCDVFSEESPVYNSSIIPEIIKVIVIIYKEKKKE